MKSIGIFYGSSRGNTEFAAKKLAREMGAGHTKIHQVSKTGIHDLEQYQHIILGCSTWGAGTLQGDFATFLPKLKQANLSGKKIAIFGAADQVAYPESFADAIGIIFNALQDSGCEIVGKTPVQGYTFDGSMALVDGMFTGLPIDEHNQAELTLHRIKKWAEQLKVEFS